MVQVISKIIDHGMGLEEAIASPRIGDDQRDLLIYEGRIPAETIAALEQMGHPTQGHDDWHRVMGSVNGCVILEDGTLVGAADPRRDGLALGL